MNPSRISRFRADPVIARCVPFSVFIAFLMLTLFLMRIAPGQGSTPGVLWLVVARGAIVALALAWFWPSYTELRAPPSGSQWLLAALAGFAVFLQWIYFDYGWLMHLRRTGFDPRRPGGDIDWVMALCRLAGFAIVVPVMEELFWRSFLLRWLMRHDFLSVEPRRVGIRAFLITAALFGLEHDRWFAGVVAGIVYNGVYVRTGNLRVPILAHAVTNGALGIWILYTQNWHFW